VRGRVLKPGLFQQEILAVQPMVVPMGITYGLDHYGGGDEMRVLQGMRIKAERLKVLETLRTNRIEHADIVREAKEGYQKKAEEALQKALADVREGKVEPLNGYTVHLRSVIDNTRVYDRAITMFEMETQAIVDLTQEQVGCLVMDEWEWKDDFIGSNAIYSAKAMRLSEDR